MREGSWPHNMNATVATLIPAVPMQCWQPMVYMVYRIICTWKSSSDFCVLVKAKGNLTTRVLLCRENMSITHNLGVTAKQLPCHTMNFSIKFAWLNLLLPAVAMLWFRCDQCLCRSTLIKAIAVHFKPTNNRKIYLLVSISSGFLACLLLT